jgi:enamine deaminase RidA (YjgF/YER057c/UK114 family)
MADKIKIKAGTKWEDLLGYSRAVKAGNIIKVSGTAAIDEKSSIVGINKPYEQTRYIIQKIEKALKEMGASLDDIVRNIVYVTDISNFNEIAKAHGEFFKNIKPALTFVEVNRFIDPEILLEIESEAIVD